MGKPERVDREKGVIYGVKILGLESANGRRYTQQAIAAAAKLYEGKAVNTDHPGKANDSRSVHDRFGWFENVKVTADGLYGDFHLVNPKTELAESLFNAAEQKPDLYGFSHNARGQSYEENGTEVIEEITEVRSVDLVAEPATTNGLFESVKPMKKTVKQICEQYLPKLTRGQQSLLKRLLEDDTMAVPMDAEMDAPAETEADPNAALKDGFHAACLPLLDAALDGDQTALKQLNDFVKTHAKIAAKPPEPEVAEEEDEDGEEVAEGEDEDMKEGDGEDTKDKKESKRHKPNPAVKELQEQLAIRDLIEDAGLKFTKPDHRKAFIKSLVPLTGDERKALIEERKNISEVQKPRSGARLTESTNGNSGKPAKSVDDLVAALKR